MHACLSEAVRHFRPRGSDQGPRTTQFVSCQVDLLAHLDIKKSIHIFSNCLFDTYIKLKFEVASASQGAV